MKKHLIFISCILLTAAVFIGCGASDAEPEVTAESVTAPVPTPVPTPEPTPMPTEYTITTESAEQIIALGDIYTLKYVDATGSTEYDAIIALTELLPECEIVWEYEFQGVKYSSNTTELTVTELEGLEDAIRYLPKLNYIDLIESPATVEDLDRYSEINPDIFFYWSFNHDGFKIRTDIEVYSSLRGSNARRLTDEDMYPMLKYCKKLKMLDLGHNDIRDLSLIGQLQELEVLIIADNPNIEDASPLANLENLTYLEFFLNSKVKDFSWLYSLTRLDALNICYCEITELDFLANMPDMRFGMFKFCNVSDEELRFWQEQLPDAYLTTNDGSIYSCEGGWRDTAQNRQIRYAFSAWRRVVDYRHYSDVDFDFNNLVYGWED